MLEMKPKQRTLHALCRLNWFFQFTFLFSPEAQFFFVAAQRNNPLDISSPSRGLHLKHCALMIVNLTNFVSASPRWRYRKIESAKKKPRYDSSKINNKNPRNLCREQFEITYMHSENGIKFDGKYRFLRSTVWRLNSNFRLFGVFKVFFSRNRNGNKRSGFIFWQARFLGFESDVCGRFDSKPKLFYF